MMRIFLLLLVTACPTCTSRVQPTSSLESAADHQWLEEDTPARLEWLRAQNRKLNTYLEKYPQEFSCWKEQTRKKLDQPVVQSQQRLRDGINIQVVYQGLGKKQELRIGNSFKESVAIFDNFQERLNGTHIISSVFPSPGGERIAVMLKESFNTEINWITILGVNKEANQAEVLWKIDEPIAGFYLKWLDEKSFQFLLKGKPFKADIDTKTYEIDETPLDFGEAPKLDDTPERIRIGGGNINLPDGKSLRWSHYRWGLRRWLELVKVSEGVDSSPARVIEIPSCCRLLSPTIADQQMSLNLTSDAVRIFRAQLPMRDHSDPVADGNLILRQFNKEAGFSVRSEERLSRSADGIMVPYRLTYRVDGKFSSLRHRPALMSVYGGFGVAHSDPEYAWQSFEFLKAGGVLVKAAMRGGGEFGLEWHQAGSENNKKMTYLDAIGVIETLIAEEITSADRFALTGGSNGGLTTMNVALMRPDLLRLAIPQNGISDMLRLQILDPAYQGWQREYLNADSGAAVERLLKTYSPLHLVARKKYPTFLIVAGQNDTRVNPAHSYKMTAALQADARNPDDIYLLSLKNAGHRMSSADIHGHLAWYTQSVIWTLLFQELGLPSPCTGT